MGRMRLGGALSAGVDPTDRSPLLRLEGSFAYLLNPFTRTRVSPYAGGGVAIQGWSDRDAEYLMLLVGVESRPGARVGWYLEGGVGGGIRLVLGVRWRPARRR
jgi:hypothetical protein